MKADLILPSKDRNYCAFVIVKGMKRGIPLMTEKGFRDEKWKLFGGRPKEIDKENGVLRPEYTAMRKVTEEGGIFVFPLEKPFLVIPKINSKREPYDFIVFTGEYSHGILRPAGVEVKNVKEFSLDEIEEMLKRNKIVRDHDRALSRYIEILKTNESFIKAFT